jgi:hypothetical protein
MQILQTAFGCSWSLLDQCWKGVGKAEENQQSRLKGNLLG